MKRGLLRHEKDVWTVGYVAIFLAVQLAAFFLVSKLWVLALISLFMLVPQCMTLSINHHHHHKFVFHPAWLNRLFEMVMFLQTGLSPFMLTIHHNLGHHQDYLTPEIDSLRWKHADSTRMSFPHYMVVNFFGLYGDTIRIGQKHPKIYRRFKVMLALSFLPLIALGAWSLPRTLIVFAIPMVLMMAHIVRMGWTCHANLETTDDFVASTNEVGALYNFLSFNIGYHTAHHLAPGVHWSEIPAYHAKIEHKVPRRLLWGAPPGSNRGRPDSLIPDSR